MSEITRAAAQGMALRSIDEITASIMANARNAALSILAIGRDLMDAKAQLGHGEWMPWLDRIGMTRSRAENYMRLAKNVAPDSPMAALPYSKALALLDAPEELRKELLDQGVEDTSAAEIRRLTKELEQTKAQAQDYYNAQQDAQGQAREAKARTKALEDRLDYALSHPETVTVEVAPADYDATKAELAKTRRLLTEAQDAAAEAEERADRATAAAQKAGMLCADHADVLDPDDVRAERFGEDCRRFISEWSPMPWLEELTVMPQHDLDNMAAMADAVRDLCDKISAACQVRRHQRMTAEGAVV